MSLVLLIVYAVVMKKYSGSCHCGGVEFEATVDIADSYVCDCSICSRKGSVMNRVTAGDFRILKGRDLLSEYTFNTGVGKHFFCSNCGVQTFHNPRSAPDIYSINLRCVPEVDIEALSPRQVYGSKLD